MGKEEMQANVALSSSLMFIKFSVIFFFFLFFGSKI